MWTIVSKLMSLQSRFVIAFLQRSKHLLISWMQSTSAVILEPKKIKSVTVSTFSPSICNEVMGLDAMILLFWILSFKPTFSLSSFTLIKRFFSSSLLSAIRVVSSAYLRLLIFLLEIFVPASDSSSLAFHMLYSSHKLNKWGAGLPRWHQWRKTSQCGRCKRQGFDPCVRTILWRGAWQPTPVFFPGKSHEQRCLVG